MKYNDFDKIKKVEEKTKNLLKEFKKETNWFVNEVSKAAYEVEKNVKNKTFETKILTIVYDKIRTNEQKEIIVINNNDFNINKVIEIKDKDVLLDNTKYITLSFLICQTKSTHIENIEDSDYLKYWNVLKCIKTDVKREEIILNLKINNDDKEENITCKALKFTV